MPSSDRLDLPFIYTFVLLWFEPIAALFGAAVLHFDATAFLRSMNPRTIFNNEHQVIYSQLGATYFLFAFNELVLLRLAARRLRRADALLVWKTVLTGILICDAIHLYGSWEALGSDVFWNPKTWRWEDWVNLGSLWGQGAVRVAFILGIGLSPIRQKVKKLN
jgi:hypothetical protein